MITQQAPTAKYYSGLFEFPEGKDFCIEMRCDYTIDKPVEYYPVDQFEKLLESDDLNATLEMNYDEDIDYVYLIDGYTDMRKIFLLDDGVLEIIDKLKEELFDDVIAAINGIKEYFPGNWWKYYPDGKTRYGELNIDR